MDNEKLISPYVSSQFPFVYRNQYPQFVEFIKTYYTWLEQTDQAVGHARRLQEYRDIDQVPEEYIDYFKNKYLPFLKFVTETDKRAIVKHVQDLYRSKGTERGVDLFFKVVYGVDADVYYPATDLFKLSDNTWIKRKYLELAHTELVSQYVGKKIIGMRSGATAFAESFVTKKVGDSYVHLLFISDVVGNFKFRERITYEGLTAARKKRPRVIGSLTYLDVTSGSSGFKVGDLVTIKSEDGYGYGAMARVANTIDATGVVEFDLKSGGWGYTVNSVALVSTKVLEIANVITDYEVNNPDNPPYGAKPYFILEEVYQPLANVNYSIDSAYQYVVVQKPNGTWYSNSAVLYQTNNSVNVAVGTIVSNSSINSTSQNLVIAVSKSLADISDFSVTSVNFSNVYLSTNSSVNSSVLEVNASINTATIEVGTDLYSYNSTGGVISSFEIISSTLTSDKQGNLFVYVFSGNVESNSYFWSNGNTFSINTSSYSDRTASGNLVGISNSVTMQISNSTAFFTPGQYLTQRRTYTGGYYVSASAKIDGIVYSGNSASVTLVNSTGVFRPTVNLYMQYANGAESAQTAYLDSFNTIIGLANLQNDFVSVGNNRIFTRGYTYNGNGEIVIHGSNTVANVVGIKSGKNATFDISNSLSYAESYSIYTDYLASNNESNIPFMSLTLANSTAYPSPVSLSFSSATNVIQVIGGTTGISAGWWVVGNGIIDDVAEILTVPNTTHITINSTTTSSNSGDYYITPGEIEWGFPKDTSGGIKYIIDDVLANINGYVGGITKLVAINPGEDYNYAPFILIRDPYLRSMGRKDFIVTYSNSNGTFIVGEQVTHSSGVKGIITKLTSTDVSQMYIQNQSVELEFVIEQQIEGLTTQATADVLVITEDESSLPMSLNANVTANVVTADGVITNLEILASGFGFNDEEGVIFLSEDGMRAGTAKANLEHQGITGGSFADSSSFLSDAKYLFDGDYYQEYSYDVKSPIPREQYIKNFEATMHLAGSKMFSTFMHTSRNDVRIDVDLPELTANLIANTA